MHIFYSIMIEKLYKFIIWLDKKKKKSFIVMPEWCSNVFCGKG